MVREKKPEIVWSKRAGKGFEEAYKHIKEDSPQNAEKVRLELLEAIRALSDHPKRYAPDKFKKHNTGDYRAFEMHNYRIAYRYTGDQVKIIRFRHVNEEPRLY